MASAVAMMVGGAAVNALAFSGSNFLFSHVGKDSDEERKRHDEAMEQLAAAQAKWNKERTQRLDFINEQLRKEHSATQEFDDIEQAMKRYYYVTGKDLQLPPKPKLSNFYNPSEDQKKREIAFVVGGMALTGFVAWKLI